jgi:hypothetical protein
MEKQERNQCNSDGRPEADPGMACSRPGGRLYEIRVRGQLTGDWSDWLDGLEMTPSAGGNTVLSGTIVDQAALMGILNKLNRLNVTLLALSQVEITGQS